MKKKMNEVVDCLTDFFDKYLPDVKEVSRNTIKSYEYAFQLLFEFLDETKQLEPKDVTFDELCGDTVIDFMNWLMSSRKCKPPTVNARRAALVTFARYAAKNKFSQALRFYSETIDTPKKKGGNNQFIKYFTREEIPLLLAFPDVGTTIGRRDVTLMSVLYGTGARAQELCDLELQDVTFASPTRVKLTGKGGKTRIITIPDNCSEILQGYLHSQNLDPNDAKSSKRHIFSSQTHEHMSVSCVEEIVKKYVIAAKKKYPQYFRQPSYSPHSFRHSIAVHMLELGESLVTIKAFLGHASIGSTTVYAKVTPELASKYLDSRGKPLSDVVGVSESSTALVAALPFLPRRFRGKQ